MSETRKIAAILVSDVVGYSRLAGVDEDRTLTTPRARRHSGDGPLERASAGQSVDVAGVVSFLVGPDGGWVNGQVVRANGGAI
jgi:hypothetical protein